MHRLPQLTLNAKNTTILLMVMFAFVVPAFTKTKDYVLMLKTHNDRALHINAGGKVTAADIAFAQPITMDTVGNPFNGDPFIITLYARQVQRFLCFRRGRLFGMKELTRDCHFSETMEHGQYMYANAYNSSLRVGFTKGFKPIGPKRLLRAHGISKDHFLFERRTPQEIYTKKLAAISTRSTTTTVKATATPKIGSSSSTSTHAPQPALAAEQSRMFATSINKDNSNNVDSLIEKNTDRLAQPARSSEGSGGGGLLEKRLRRLHAPHRAEQSKSSNSIKSQHRSRQMQRRKQQQHQRQRPLQPKNLVRHHHNNSTKMARRRQHEREQLLRKQSRRRQHVLQQHAAAEDFDQHQQPEADEEEPERRQHGRQRHQRDGMGSGGSATSSATATAASALTATAASLVPSTLNIMALLAASRRKNGRRKKQAAASKEGGSATASASTENADMQIAVAQTATTANVSSNSSETVAAGTADSADLEWERERHRERKLAREHELALQIERERQRLLEAALPAHRHRHHHELPPQQQQQETNEYSNSNLNNLNLISHNNEREESVEEEATMNALPALPKNYLPVGDQPQTLPNNHHNDDADDSGEVGHRQQQHADVDASSSHSHRQHKPSHSHSRSRSSDSINPSMTDYSSSTPQNIAKYNSQPDDAAEHQQILENGRIVPELSHNSLSRQRRALKTTVAEKTTVRPQTTSSGTSFRSISNNQNMAEGEKNVAEEQLPPNDNNSKLRSILIKRNNFHINAANINDNNNNNLLRNNVYIAAAVADDNAMNAQNNAAEDAAADNNNLDNNIYVQNNNNNNIADAIFGFIARAFHNYNNYINNNDAAAVHNVNNINNPENINNNNIENIANHNIVENIEQVFAYHKRLFRSLNYANPNTNYANVNANAYIQYNNHLSDDYVYDVAKSLSNYSPNDKKHDVRDDNDDTLKRNQNKYEMTIVQYRYVVHYVVWGVVMGGMR